MSKQELNSVDKQELNPVDITFTTLDGKEYHGQIHIIPGIRFSDHIEFNVKLWLKCFNCKKINTNNPVVQTEKFRMFNINHMINIGEKKY